MTCMRSPLRTPPPPCTGKTSSRRPHGARHVFCFHRSLRVRSRVSMRERVAHVRSTMRRTAGIETMEPLCECRACARLDGAPRLPLLASVSCWVAARPAHHLGTAAPPPLCSGRGTQKRAASTGARGRRLDFRGGRGRDVWSREDAHARLDDDASGSAQNCRGAQEACGVRAAQAGRLRVSAGKVGAPLGPLLHLLQDTATRQLCPLSQQTPSAPPSLVHAGRRRLLLVWGLGRRGARVFCAGSAAHACGGQINAIDALGWGVVVCRTCTSWWILGAWLASCGRCATLPLLLF